nr:uncharacterized protein LOC129281263 [Lytechinus pictus]
MHRIVCDQLVIVTALIIDIVESECEMDKFLIRVQPGSAKRPEPAPEASPNRDTVEKDKPKKKQKKKQYSSTELKLHYSTTNASTTSFTIEDLEPSETYRIRVLTRRTSVAGRRKRADIAENVGISAEVLYVTCQNGLQGLNCEDPVVDPSTEQPTEPPTLPRRTTVAPSSVPWRDILIGLLVVFGILVIILIFIIILIYGKVKRRRTRMAKIQEVNNGTQRGYRQSDVLYATDSNSYTSSEVDDHHNGVDYGQDVVADPGHVRISMVGHRDNMRDAGTSTRWTNSPGYNNGMYRYNAAYDPSEADNM